MTANPMTARPAFTKPFTQQEPIPPAAIERAVEIMQSGRLHRYINAEDFAIRFPHTTVGTPTLPPLQRLGTQYPGRNTGDLTQAPAWRKLICMFFED